MVELKKRRLGKTDLMVTELALGTLDTANVPEGRETIHLALDLGVNFIDTARIYEGAEYLIGQVIRERGEKNFHLSTKTVNRTRDGAQYDIDRSLRLLGIDKIDLYELDDVAPQDWDSILTEAGALEGLKIAQFLGKIDHIGMSSHFPEVVEKAITCGEFAAVMLEYSAFSPETERLLALAKEHDVGTLIMRPIGGSGRTTTLRGMLRAGQQDAPLTPALLLRYVLSNPNVSAAVVGVRFPDRMRENVETASSYEPLTEEQRRACEEAAARLGI